MASPIGSAALITNSNVGWVWPLSTGRAATLFGKVGSVVENWVPRLVFGCILLAVIAYGYYVSRRYGDCPKHSGQEVESAGAGAVASVETSKTAGINNKVGVYAVKEGDVKCGYLYGNKKERGCIEVIGYSIPSKGEYFLLKSPKMVGFKGVSLKDTGNLYNAEALREVLEQRGAYLVSDTLYLVDKEHTEQWALK